MGFRVVVYGMDALQLHFSEAVNRTYDMRAAFEEIYLTALDIIDENFDTRGARGGNKPWEMLSFQYIKYKAREYPGHATDILEAAGDLRRSITTPNHPNQYKRVERDKVVFSSLVESIDGYRYGKVHQRGSKKANIPARPYIRFTEADATAFGKEIKAHVMKAFKGGKKV